MYICIYTYNKYIYKQLCNMYILSIQYIDNIYNLFIIQIYLMLYVQVQEMKSKIDITFIQIKKIIEYEIFLLNNNYLLLQHRFERKKLPYVKI